METELTSDQQGGAQTPVLELRDLTYGYARAQPIVRDVSATLAGGKVCALVGPNAAGKTTLLKIILGQLDAWSGGVRVGGHPLASLDPTRRAERVSYVPQRSHTGFAFTVERVVAMGRFALGRDDDAVEAAIQVCDLSGIRSATYAHLSVGQQQRVLLARAMAQSRGGGQLMLLDEPGSAMDLWHVHQCMRGLRQLAASGLAVLVVLHDLSLAVRYADEAWVMDGGELVAAGPCDEVMTPGVLEPVFRVRIEAHRLPGMDRPVLVTDAADSGAA